MARDTPCFYFFKKIPFLKEGKKRSQYEFLQWNLFSFVAKKGKKKANEFSLFITPPFV
jgi:hypothetical protein